MSSFNNSFRENHLITQKRVAWVALFAILGFAAFPAVATPPGSAGELLARCAEVGRNLDRYYYDAGTRVDVAGYDFRELSAQGKNTPRGLLAEIEASDRAMRSRWMNLDRHVQEIRKGIHGMPPAVENKYILQVESLEEKLAADDGWIGLRSAKFVWPDGTKVDLSPKSFVGGTFHANYSYGCEPSDGVFVYGQRSLRCKTRAGFDLAPLPEGNARLIVSGQDCDKAGISRIRLEVNGQKIFEGPNPFKKHGWSEHAFDVPSSAFRQTMVEGGGDKNRQKAELLALGVEVESFGVWSKQLADAMDAKTVSFRKGLVYRPAATVRSMDGWKNHFVRGMCFQTDSANADPNYKPWYYDHPEYTAKAMLNVGASMLYLYLDGESQKVFASEFEKVGIPYLLCPSQIFHSVADPEYYLRESHLWQENLAFIKGQAKEHPLFLGASVDEPTIFDGRAKETEVVKAYREYLSTRRADLDAVGVSVSNASQPVTEIKAPGDRVLWMEWQMFKKRFMAEHFQWLWNECGKMGVIPFVIIMNQNHTKPQECSYVSMSELPLISTDLYNNGTVYEAFSMQLLHHAAKGKAIMTSGSGYSCKNQDRFRRSLAVAMVHADGVLQWVYTYCSKYRNTYFWHNPDSKDDRGADMFDNWRPEFWDLQKEMFAKMEASDRWLSGTESTADVVLLHSERTAIAGGIKSAAAYESANLVLYSYLIEQHRPVDVAYVESMNATRMKRYRVAVLADAQVMTPGEMEMIREWVNSGGTLIASAGTSLCDPWGRAQKDFALAGVFGAHHIEEASGAVKCSGIGINIEYDKNASYMRIKAESDDEVLATWDTGDVALVNHKEGKGQAYYFTSKNMGARDFRPSARSALPGRANPGVTDLLARVIHKAVGDDPISVLGLPEGVEVQIHKKEADYVVHLLDWHDERDVNGAELKINLPGKWEISHPFHQKEFTEVSSGKATVPPFHLYEIVVLRPKDADKK